MTTEMAEPTTEIAKAEPQRSLVRTMSARYELSEANFLVTVKKTCFTGKAADPTNEELMIFLGIAEKYDLDPFVKEVTAFPKKGGGISTVVTIDGWIKLIQKQPMLDGFTFEDHFGEGGEQGSTALVAVTCRIYRKDQKHPTECTEYMIECRTTGDTYTPWNRWPKRMLRHKALIQCARYAFGFSGIIDPDEALRMAPTTPSSDDGHEASRTTPQAHSATELMKPVLAGDQSNPHERPAETVLAHSKVVKRTWLDEDHGAQPQSEGPPADHPTRTMNVPDEKPVDAVFVPTKKAPSADQQTAQEPDTAIQTGNGDKGSEEKGESRTERTNRLRLAAMDANSDDLADIKSWVLRHPSEFTQVQYKKLMALCEKREREAANESSPQASPAGPTYEEQIAAATTVSLPHVLSQIIADGTTGSLAKNFDRYKALIQAIKDRESELKELSRQS